MSNCSEQCARGHLVVLMGEERDATAHEREIAIDTYAAAVSRARDAEWREEINGVRVSLTCDCMGEHLTPCEDVGCKAVHAALDAVLARMDTASAGGANG